MPHVLAWGMVFINEWLPNPTGPDAAGEFVELYNNGSSSVDLSGWRLETESHKRSVLKNRSIGPDAFILLKKEDTKLSLRNTDGGLALYDAPGVLIDSRRFYGAAPEGKSFSRTASQFSFADPTPGEANAPPAALAIQHHPAGTPLNPPLDTSGFFAIMMGTAAVIVGASFYVIKANKDLSDLLFG